MPLIEGTKDNFSPDNYYSLVELLNKIGKEGVAELVSKGKPQRITRGDMIYFIKTDVHRILGRDLSQAIEEEASAEIIIDDSLEFDEEKPTDFISQLVFKQSLTKRYEVGQDKEIYRDKKLNLNEEILYGRSKGDPQDQIQFKECRLISSLHGRLFLDEDKNLLFENLGANKSKIRGCKDQTYTVLEKDELGVLMTKEALEEVVKTSQPLIASVKLGYQAKPHFIIRIYVINKANEAKLAKLDFKD